jgi:hypothetical protein
VIRTGMRGFSCHLSERPDKISSIVENRISTKNLTT